MDYEAVESLVPRKFENKTSMVSLIFLRFRDIHDSELGSISACATYDLPAADLLDSNYRNVHRLCDLPRTLTKILQTDATINPASAKI